MDAVRRRFGMMFQDGALFSSLTVAQNVAVPLIEHAAVPPALLQPLIALRLAQAGLGPDAAEKMPSELSGGMRKRAAIARALALEPEVLFLDEPTSGLDPTTARGFDALVRSLVDDLGITVFLVTHDLDTLLTVVDRIIVLAAARCLPTAPCARSSRSTTRGSSPTSRSAPRWPRERDRALRCPLCEQVLESPSMEAESKYTYVGLALVSSSPRW